MNYVGAVVVVTLLAVGIASAQDEAESGEAAKHGPTHSTSRTGVY